MNSKKKIIRGLVSTIIIIVLVTLGGKVYMNNKENEKIENQKETAINIKGIISGLKEIKFSDDGGKISGTENDFGKWSIGVDLKLSDELWYTISASKEGVEGMKSGFPDRNMHGGTSSPVKVIYSNGKREILK